MYNMTRPEASIQPMKQGNNCACRLNQFTVNFRCFAKVGTVVLLELAGMQTSQDDEMRQRP